jgi:hypothetical protein
VLWNLVIVTHVNSQGEYELMENCEILKDQQFNIVVKADLIF